MKKKEKTVITIEMRQRTLIHRNRQKIFAWCEWCAAKTLVVLPDEAAKLRGISPRAIYRQIEDGDLHFTETENDALLICNNSLSIKNKKQ